MILCKETSLVLIYIDSCEQGVNWIINKWTASGNINAISIEKILPTLLQWCKVKPSDSTWKRREGHYFSFYFSGSVQNLGHHHDSIVSCAQPPWKLNVPEQAVGRALSLHPAPQLPVFQTPSDDQ